MCDLCVAHGDRAAGAALGSSLLGDETQLKSQLALTGSIYDIETTVFDPASVFLSTHR